MKCRADEGQYYLKKNNMQRQGQWRQKTLAYWVKWWCSYAKRRGWIYPCTTVLVQSGSSFLLCVFWKLLVLVLVLLQITSTLLFQGFLVASEIQKISSTYNSTSFCLSITQCKYDIQIVTRRSWLCGLPCDVNP